MLWVKYRCVEWSYAPGEGLHRETVGVEVFLGICGKIPNANLGSETSLHVLSPNPNPNFMVGVKSYSGNIKDQVLLQKHELAVMSRH